MKSHQGTISRTHQRADREKSQGRRLAVKPSRFSIAMAGLMMLGIAMGQGIGVARFEMQAVMLGALMLAGGIWIWSGLRSWRMVTPIAMVMTMILLGLILQSTINPRYDITVVPQERVITGQVKMAEVMTKNRQRIRLHPEATDLWTGGEQDASDFDLRLITSRQSNRGANQESITKVKPGDVINGVVRINPPLPQLLPGSFDFTAHAHQQGYAATGFIKEITVIDHKPVSWVNRLRFYIQRQFSTHLDADQAAVASAVIIGLRAGINPELREDYRAAGLAHLLAISGLHMALFWGSVVALIRAGLALFPHFSSRYPSLKIATLAAMPFGLFYLVVSGQPISAVRAFLMLALVMLAILLSRRGMTLHHVALVAMGILIVAPQSMMHPAFQMSFAAVYALVSGWMLITRYRYLIQNIPWVLRYTGGIIIASVLAAGASAPFVLHHFGVTTVWSVLANIAGMPLMGVVVIPFGALSLLLMPFGLEGFPLTVMGMGIDGLNRVASAISGQPLSEIILPPPSGLVLVLLTAALLMPACLKGRWRLAAIIPLITAIIVWHVTPVPMISFTKLHGRSIAAFHAEDSRIYLSHHKVNDYTQGILTKPFGQASVGSISDYPCPDCGRGYHLIPLVDGRIAAMVYRGEGLTRACREADIVLTRQAPKYLCKAGLIVSDDDLDRHGGVLIYAGNPPILESVTNETGQKFGFNIGE